MSDPENELQRQLAEERSVIFVGERSPGQPLLVAFTGLAPQSPANLQSILTGGKDSRPPFEFMRLGTEIGGNALFFRDYDVAWYQRGLKGVGATVDDIAQYIREEIDTLRPSKVVFTGASAGGFAAILFGVLCGHGVTALAFGSQTFVDQENVRRYGETRWMEHIPALWSLPASLARLDLKKVIEDHPAHRCSIHLFYSRHIPKYENPQMDAIQAEHLKGMRQVTLHPTDFPGHNVAKHLRDTGEIKRLMADALGIVPASEPPPEPVVLPSVPNAKWNPLRWLGKS